MCSVIFIHYIHDCVDFPVFVHNLGKLNPRLHTLSCNSPNVVKHRSTPCPVNPLAVDNTVVMIPAGIIVIKSAIDSQKINPTYKSIHTAFLCKQTSVTLDMPLPVVLTVPVDECTRG